MAACVHWGRGGGISDPDIDYTTAPANLVKHVEFMQKAGRLKHLPTSWKDMFFAQGARSQRQPNPLPDAVLLEQIGREVQPEAGSGWHGHLAVDRHRRIVEQAPSSGHRHPYCRLRPPSHA